MLLKAVVLAGGIAGAAGLSQFPEFSQQYVQRLGGAVDELDRFAAAFDADAAALGLSREAALEDLRQSGAMAARRAETVAATLQRHDRLSADLEALKSAGPFTRAYRAARLNDGEIAARAWAAFRPAMPLSLEAAVFGAIGLIAGMAAMAGGLGLLMRLMRLTRLFRPAKPAAAP